MRESQIQKLEIQLGEAIQMLRLVAAEERTCVEIREWLDRNYPFDEDEDSKPVVDMLTRAGNRNVKD